MTSPEPRDQSFSRRLHESLASAGIRNSPTIVAREFNLRAREHVITVHGVRKWLVGEAVPTQKRMVMLAAWLNVDVHWLRFGGGPLKVVLHHEKLAHADVLAIRDYQILPDRDRKLVRALIKSLAAGSMQKIYH